MDETDIFVWGLRAEVEGRRDDAFQEGPLFWNKSFLAVFPVWVCILPTLIANTGRNCWLPSMNLNSDGEWLLSPLVSGGTDPEWSQMGDQPDQGTWSGRWHREGKGSVTLLLQPQLDSQRGRAQGEPGPWAEYKPLTRRQKPAAMTPRRDRRRHQPSEWGGEPSGRRGALPLWRRGPSGLSLALLILFTGSYSWWRG